MLAVNAARPDRRLSLQDHAAEPYVPYIHLLVDYHFGFIKRALIGAIVSLFHESAGVAGVRAWRAPSGWSTLLGCSLKLFRTNLRPSTASTLPLFVFMAGSPFFLKNFMYTLGHFDIYGCALRDLPAAGAGALDCCSCSLAALLSIVLILIHHIHLLMYVPTIAVIVVLRHYLVQGI